MTTHNQQTGQAAKHTATPWHIDGNYIVGERLVAKLCRHHFENDNQTSYPEQNRALRDEYEANAEFICRAVNSHYELVAALERLEASAVNLHCALQSTAHMDPNDSRIPVITGSVVRDLQAMQDQARSALAKAQA
jgi:hypothetical protein